MTRIHLEEARTGIGFPPSIGFFQPEPEFVTANPVPVELEPDFSESNPVPAGNGFPGQTKISAGTGILQMQAYSN